MQPKEFRKRLLSINSGRRKDQSQPKVILRPPFGGYESLLSLKSTKTSASSYIHLQDNVVSIDAELCQVDVDRFLLLLRNGEEKEKAGEVKEALLIYNDAIEMYKGDFLAEEFYIPWANRKREELKGKYIELLSKAAQPS